MDVDQEGVVMLSWARASLYFSPLGRRRCRGGVVACQVPQGRPLRGNGCIRVAVDTPLGANTIADLRQLRNDVTAACQTAPNARVCRVFSLEVRQTAIRCLAFGPKLEAPTPVSALEQK
jgi:hypothetical protein